MLDSRVKKKKRKDRPTDFYEGEGNALFGFYAFPDCIFSWIFIHLQTGIGGEALLLLADDVDDGCLLCMGCVDDRRNHIPIVEEQRAPRTWSGLGSLARQSLMLLSMWLPAIIGHLLLVAVVVAMDGCGATIPFIVRTTFCIIISQETATSVRCWYLCRETKGSRRRMMFNLLCSSVVFWQWVFVWCGDSWSKETWIHTTAGNE